LRRWPSRAALAWAWTRIDGVTRDSRELRGVSRRGGSEGRPVWAAGPWRRHPTAARRARDRRGDAWGEARAGPSGCDSAARRVPVEHPWPLQHIAEWLSRGLRRLFPLATAGRGPDPLIGCSRRGGSRIVLHPASERRRAADLISQVIEVTVNDMLETVVKLGAYEPRRERSDARETCSGPSGSSGP
jgi:hypothetical protein